MQAILALEIIKKCTEVNKTSAEKYVLSLYRFVSKYSRVETLQRMSWITETCIIVHVCNKPISMPAYHN